MLPSASVPFPVGILQLELEAAGRAQALDRRCIHREGEPVLDAEQPPLRGANDVRAWPVPRRARPRASGSRTPRRRSIAPSR